MKLIIILMVMGLLHYVKLDTFLPRMTWFAKFEDKLSGVSENYWIASILILAPILLVACLITFLLPEWFLLLFYARILELYYDAG